MNTRERITSIIAANKAEQLAVKNAQQVKNLLDYKLTLVYKRLEIDGKIAKVEAELKRLNLLTETKEEGTRIATNDN